ncbi:DUF221 domain containing protein [Hyaloscypha variabilis]
MTDAILEGFVQYLRRDLNTSNDPRVGSARDNSTSVSPLRATQGTNSPSFATFFTTLIPITVYAVVCFTILFVLRRKFVRVYSPRTILTSLEPHERAQKLPSGWFNWVIPFWKTPDIEVLNRSSLEGYLFLRYLKVLTIICCVGLLLTWPILIPIHALGGMGSQQLDKLTFGNVAHPTWLYAHALIAWVYFGFILYMVSRESVYFINLRQAYLLSPYYANRLSSRTVLFTCVPQQVLDERKLRRIFGDTLKNVWIPRETNDLDQLVREREQTAHRLEKAEIELIKTANAAYQKALKNGHPDIEVKESPRDSREETKEVKISVNPQSPLSPTSPASPREFTREDGTPILRTNYGFTGPDPDVVGSVASQWISAEQRPYHRPIANYGRRVDTIRWTRARLKKLAPKISQLRRQYRKGVNAPIPAAFIEFHSLVDAQSAYQTLAHHSANHMRAEIIGVRPQEIIWSSLSFRWWERIVRRFLIQGFIACMVIFWSLPSILVGMISNIDYLAKEVHFLHWILLLPKIILGLISGLLPSVALSLLMSTVPFILRACARQSGIPTESRVELFVQSSYFVFQVVQVFLVTTLTSAASAAITQIIKDPLSARTLLSTNLPTASNFYISYFILQGLALSATRIVHLLSIFRHQVMPYAGGCPRVIAAKYHRLRKIHWGALYPVFTNMAVIAISYSLIAPIILGVAAIGLSIIYITYKYNLLYVYSCERDTRGLHYPRALTQTLTGLYLAEVCLVGLFGLKGAYGPVVMTFGLIIFTSLIHVSLNDALSPLLYNLPRTLAAEEELRKLGNPPFLAANLTDVHDTDVPDYEAGGDADAYDSDFDPSDPPAVSHGEQTSRSLAGDIPLPLPVEGADKALTLSTRTLSSLLKKKIDATPIPGLVKLVDFWTPIITPDPNLKQNFVIRWLHPEIFDSYHVLRDRIPAELRELDPSLPYNSSTSTSNPNNGNENETEGGSDMNILKDAYSPPSIRQRSPRLWIPRDPAGISRQEVAHSSKVIEMKDEDAWVDEKGRLSVEMDGVVERWVERVGEGGRGGLDKMGRGMRMNEMDILGL